MTSSEYRMPALPLGGPEATIARWLKRPGDPLSPGEPLLIVVNDRVEVALPVQASGLLAAHQCAEGSAVTAGVVLATLTPSAPVPDAPTLAPARPAFSAPPLNRSTPVARRIAAAHDLDLGSVTGQGVSGRVTKADVLAVLAPQSPAASPFLESALPVDAAVVLASRAPLCAPVDTQVITVIEVDLGPVVAACQRQQNSFARRGLRLSASTFVLEAVVEALLRYPLLNGRWGEEYIIMRRQIDFVLSTSNRRVRVPGAQDMNLRGLARALQTAPDAAPGDTTFTVVEYGEATWCGMPALAPGQSAALGIGSPRIQPTVVYQRGAERVGIRPIQMLALAYDARAVDQCYADAFLRDVKARLEDHA